MALGTGIYPYWIASHLCGGFLLFAKMILNAWSLQFGITGEHKNLFSIANTKTVKDNIDQLWTLRIQPFI